MSAQRIETLIWALIYGGLIAGCLGWFITPASGLWREILMIGGGTAVAAGIVLIVMRSRMKP